MEELRTTALITLLSMIIAMGAYMSMRKMKGGVEG